MVAVVVDNVVELVGIAHLTTLRMRRIACADCSRCSCLRWVVGVVGWCRWNGCACSLVVGRGVGVIGVGGLAVDDFCCSPFVADW